MGKASSPRLAVAAAAKMVKAGKKQPPPTFVEKLYDFIEDPSTRIRWTDEGRAFSVDNVSDLEEDLGKAFNSNAFQSFTRQLSLYGFRLLPSASNGDPKGKRHVYEWSRDHFERGKVHLLPLIKRKKSTPRASQPQLQQDVGGGGVAAGAAADGDDEVGDSAGSCGGGGSGGGGSGDVTALLRQLSARMDRLEQEQLVMKQAMGQADAKFREIVSESTELGRRVRSLESSDARIRTHVDSLRTITQRVLEIARSGGAAVSAASGVPSGPPSLLLPHRQAAPASSAPSSSSAAAAATAAAAAGISEEKRRLLIGLELERTPLRYGGGGGSSRSDKAVEVGWCQDDRGRQRASGGEGLVSDASARAADDAEMSCFFRFPDDMTSVSSPVPSPSPAPSTTHSLKRQRIDVGDGGEDAAGDGWHGSSVRVTTPSGASPANVPTADFEASPIGIDRLSLHSPRHSVATVLAEGAGGDATGGSHGPDDDVFAPSPSMTTLHSLRRDGSIDSRGIVPSFAGLSRADSSLGGMSASSSDQLNDAFLANIFNSNGALLNFAAAAADAVASGNGPYRFNGGSGGGGDGGGSGGGALPVASYMDSIAPEAAAAATMAVLEQHLNMASRTATATAAAAASAATSHALSSGFSPAGPTDITLMRLDVDVPSAVAAAAATVGVIDGSSGGGDKPVTLAGPSGAEEWAEGDRVVEMISGAAARPSGCEMS